jgi:hypothetical protein
VGSLQPCSNLTRGIAYQRPSVRFLSHVQRGKTGVRTKSQKCRMVVCLHIPDAGFILPCRLRMSVHPHYSRSLLITLGSEVDALLIPSLTWGGRTNKADARRRPHPWRWWSLPLLTSACIWQKPCCRCGGRGGWKGFGGKQNGRQRRSTAHIVLHGRVKPGGPCQFGRNYAEGLTGLGLQQKTSASLPGSAFFSGLQRFACDHDGFGELPGFMN